jgi:hypothetical protein
MQQDDKSYKEALLSYMVAGDGVGLGRTSGVPRFDDQNFDGWMFFIKSFLVKFDRADLALTEPMPMRDTADEEGEDYPYLDPALEKAYQRKRHKWLDLYQSRVRKTSGQIHSRRGHVGCPRSQDPKGKIQGGPAVSQAS